MAEDHQDKRTITAALSAERAELRTLSLLLRRNLDIRRYLLESRRRHLWGWMSAAAILGWILSRLPPRKHKIYLQPADLEKFHRKQAGGGLLRPAWEGTWSMTKPFVAAYLAKKIAESAKDQGPNALSEAIRWTASFIKGIKVG